jgi:hypothetical protein
MIIRLPLYVLNGIKMFMPRKKIRLNDTKNVLLLPPQLNFVSHQNFCLQIFLYVLISTLIHTLRAYHQNSATAAAATNLLV